MHYVGKTIQIMWQKCVMLFMDDPPACLHVEFGFRVQIWRLCNVFHDVIGYFEIGNGMKGDEREKGEFRHRF